ncbi:MAG: sulfotransferase [Candidatus Electrothrix sp. MAN1_4]|nr:sulfotransferase [Candidatus Electrothrix sp. MAN1_4]
MANSNGKNLIFLISQPRSGSTMLQLMLAGHPDIATTSEPWIALHPLFALKQGIDAKYDTGIARLALKEFLQQSGVNEVFYKKKVNDFLSSFYSQAIKHQQKKYFLDKTPRYYLIIDDLIEIFPKAKFIILHRHPLAVLNSIIKTWVKDDLKRLGLFKDDLLLAPKYLTGASKKYSDRIYSIKYEDFVESPEMTLDKVCNYLGIKYHENMSEYSKRIPNWKLGDPTGIHKSSRPFNDSLQSWKKGFESPNLKLMAHSYVKELGQGVVEEMGYDFDEITSQISSLDNCNIINMITWSDVMQYNQFEAEKDLFEAKLKTIRNSWSWKITAPIRATSTLLLKLKQLSIK